MAKLKYIRFSSYKKFEETTEIEIKQLTVLIGKNSSGKSSISKLFPMFEKATSVLNFVTSCSFGIKFMMQTT